MTRIPWHTRPWLTSRTATTMTLTPHPRQGLQTLPMAPTTKDPNRPRLSLPMALTPVLRQGGKETSPPRFSTSTRTWGAIGNTLIVVPLSRCLHRPWDNMARPHTPTLPSTIMPINHKGLHLRWAISHTLRKYNDVSLFFCRLPG